MYELVHKQGCLNPRVQLARRGSGIRDGRYYYRDVLVCDSCGLEMEVQWPSSHPHKPGCRDRTVAETVELPDGGPMRSVRRCRGCGVEVSEENQKAVAWRWNR